MTDQLRTALTILRRKQAQALTGLPRSTFYERIKQGLLTSPVSLGPRAVGFPLHEIEAVNAARIAGKDDEAIRALVAHLEAARKAAA